MDIFNARNIFQNPSDNLRLARQRMKYVSNRKWLKRGFQVAGSFSHIIYNHLADQALKLCDS